MSSFATLLEPEFGEKVLGSVLPVVLDFGADWCGPCKRLGPELEKLAQTFGSRLKYYQVNVDECANLAGQLGIMSVPTVLVFSSGQEKLRIIGFQPAVKLIEKINKIIV